MWQKYILIITNIMLYIVKIDYYLKILTDEKVEDFIVISFSEYFKSIREDVRF